MHFSIEFNEEKNILLRETRKVCFDDVVEVVKNGKVLGNLEHHRPKYSRQKILVVEIRKYVYAVPYVIDKRKGAIFLKTVYPSRVLTEKYLGEKRK